MMDSFRPLHVAMEALELEDTGYLRSWVEGQTGFVPPTS